MTSLHLDVQCYDEEHERLLALDDDIKRGIEELGGDGIDVEVDEFLLLSAFSHQDGFRTRAELAGIVSKFREMLDLYFDLSAGTVHSRYTGQDRTNKDFTEKCGVGGTLVVAEHLFDLHEADWEAISITQTKDLDFQLLASDGSRFIKVEAKGRIVDDVTKRGEVSDAKTSIVQKKHAQRKLSPSRNDILLGVIVAIPSSENQVTRCLLVDPPIQIPLDDPGKYRLLARLAHYLRELSVLTRAHFLIALANRVHALALADNHQVFDMEKLRKQDGEQFESPNSIFQTRSVVDDDYAFGEVLVSSAGDCYFYGLLSEVVDLMIEQSHEKISGYRSTEAGEAHSRKVLARIVKQEAKALGLDPEKLTKVPQTSRVEVSMVGTLTTTAGGHVLGPVEYVRASSDEEGN
ncbi:hypothetical protein NZK35_23140 [Stieleria sp. ICT_E10.1]|uniref:hypothetical protein n=1 Tax=Stieleria sedimenti TaxID=2976331 RepID=UPI00217FBC14|nr:hypothetical protein [Stieleria sedimenti]MCS7469558.1 hypothetical protein [Stieleria sedimenti]